MIDWRMLRELAECDGTNEDVVAVSVALESYLHTPEGEAEVARIAEELKMAEADS